MFGELDDLEEPEEFVELNEFEVFGIIEDYEEALGFRDCQSTETLISEFGAIYIEPQSLDNGKYLSIIIYMNPEYHPHGSNVIEFKLELQIHLGLAKGYAPIDVINALNTSANLNILNDSIKYGNGVFIESLSRILYVIVPNGVIKDIKK